MRVRLHSTAWYASNLSVAEGPAPAQAHEGSWLSAAACRHMDKEHRRRLPPKAPSPHPTRHPRPRLLTCMPCTGVFQGLRDKWSGGLMGSAPTGFLLLFPTCMLVCLEVRGRAQRPLLSAYVAGLHLGLCMAHAMPEVPQHSHLFFIALLSQSFFHTRFQSRGLPCAPAAHLRRGPTTS